jgi:hypothetical protein
MVGTTENGNTHLNKLRRQSLAAFDLNVIAPARVVAWEQFLGVAFGIIIHASCLLMFGHNKQGMLQPITLGVRDQVDLIYDNYVRELDLVDQQVGHSARIFLTERLPCVCRLSASSRSMLKLTAFTTVTMLSIKIRLSLVLCNNITFMAAKIKIDVRCDNYHLPLKQCLDIPIYGLSRYRKDSAANTTSVKALCAEPCSARVSPRYVERDLPQ